MGVLPCVSFVVQLTIWKVLVGSLLLTDHALKLAACHARVGNPIEGMNFLFFFALFASVAFGAPQKEVLTCVSFVVQLTVWKVLVGTLLPTNHALKLAASHARVGNPIEGMNILLFFALFASVAFGAPQEEVSSCVSFVVQLTVWKVLVGTLLPTNLAFALEFAASHAQSRIGHHR